MKKAHIICIVAAVIAVALFAACGNSYETAKKTEPTETVAPQPSPTPTPEPTPDPTPTPSPSPTPTPAPEPTPTPEPTPEPTPGPSTALIDKELAASIPQSYQGDKWFYAYSELTGDTDKSASVSMQINIGQSDTDTARDIAVSFYEIANTAAEKGYAELIQYSCVIVNNGAPVAMFSTLDGHTYTQIVNGKRSEFAV